MIAYFALQQYPKLTKCHESDKKGLLKLTKVNFDKERLSQNAFFRNQKPV